MADVLPDWNLPIPRLPSPRKATEEERPLPAPSPTAAAPATSRGLKSRSARLPPSREDARKLDAAVASWLEICGVMGTAFGAKAKLTPLNEVNLKPFLRLSRPGTLQVHASAWRLYLRYAEDEGLNPADLDETAAYMYLQHLTEAGAPPSRAGGFLKACNFSFGIFEFLQGHVIASSARCRGEAAANQARKRVRRQRDPLTMDQVKAMELEVTLANNGSGVLTKPEAVVAGFLLMCIHGRARCSDVAKIIDEPTLDEAADGDPTASFVEASTTGAAMKTGNTEDKSSLLFPVVALSRGLSNLPWGEAWLALRGEACMDAADDECLMLEPLSQGEFGEGRIEAGQATDWLRHILHKLGFAPETLTNIGSHSCKVTFLSVCAKAGMVRDLRRILGGHALPGDRSVDVYSRDVLAYPLLELGRLMEKIRNGEFHPDSSRSGRWKRPVPTQEEVANEICKNCEKSLKGAKLFQCECGNTVHEKVGLVDGCTVTCPWCLEDFCGLCYTLGLHACQISEAESSDSSSSSEDDSDGEKVQMALEDEEAIEEEIMTAKAFVEKGFGDGTDAAFPEGGIFVNKVSGIVHMVKDPHTCACGTVADETRFEYYYEASAMLGRRLCWRSGCSKWEVLQQEVTEL